MSFFLSRIMAALKRSRTTNYHEYIQSDEWKRRAQSIKENRGYRCALCSVSGYAVTLNVHHNTYERLGNELDSDLTVLCEDCHSHFHAGSIKPGRKVRIDAKEFAVILRGAYRNNEDPYRGYERGKIVIQHILNGWDGGLYDYYNRMNIDMLNKQLDKQDRERYLDAKASGNWRGYDNEYDWRANNEYWTGWKR